MQGFASTLASLIAELATQAQYTGTASFSVGSLFAEMGLGPVAVLGDGSLVVATLGISGHIELGLVTLSGDGTLAVTLRSDLPLTSIDFSAAASFTADVVLSNILALGVLDVTGAGLFTANIGVRGRQRALWERSTPRSLWQRSRPRALWERSTPRSLWQR
jgi:hypothetical protein